MGSHQPIMSSSAWNLFSLPSRYSADGSAYRQLSPLGQIITAEGSKRDHFYTRETPMTGQTIHLVQSDRVGSTVSKSAQYTESVILWVSVLLFQQPN